MAWYNESRRHSMSSRGIKTAQKIPKMPKSMAMPNFKVTLIKDVTLRNFARKLLRNGYVLYTTADRKDIGWFTVVKDNKMANVSRDTYSGVSISTVHKGSRKFGTGYNIVDRTFEPTIAEVEQALNTVKPRWDYRSKGMPEKYTSFKEYTSDSMNQILKRKKITL